MRKKCAHGKQKCRCRDCGGTSFCRHGIRKSTCRDCGGTSFCPHGKRKSECKACKSAKQFQAGLDALEKQEASGLEVSTNYAASSYPAPPSTTGSSIAPGDFLRANNRFARQQLRTARAAERAAEADQVLLAQQELAAAMPPPAPRGRRRGRGDTGGLFEERSFLDDVAAFEATTGETEASE